ncbi:MAG: ribonucleoside-diphosphate reductase, adenosylcobalamin-dependent, partial [Rhodospirillaceae bacterium]|nr:ribonucleoside-diphosphate reductase, adenosylcobalamin-dependent [Rhodospirillaceae bacterium]
QAFVDSSISKTINCPEEMEFDDFKDVYMRAYDLGCKGCTTYRPNPVTGAVLESASGAEEGSDATPAAANDAQPTVAAVQTLPAARQSELPLEPPPARPRDAFEAGAVIHITRPLERPEALHGSTYKIRWPESDHAIYITINDIVRDGRRQPFEIFINSKNTEHYAWTVALTRMISAVFRRGGDVSFIVEELKAVFDPRGGQWMGGHYVPSILAAIGGVIEQHLVSIGALAPPEAAQLQPPAPENGDTPARAVRFCGRCGQPGLLHREGCDLCPACGYSKCA